VAQIIKFVCLVGLRPTEAIDSVKLLKSGSATNYYNPERQGMEHFRLPEILLRKTKQAYVSFVSPEMVEFATNFDLRESSSVPTYTAISKKLRRLELNCNLSDIVGSYMVHGYTNMVEYL